MRSIPPAQVVEAAEREIGAPTIGVSKQLLAVHTPVRDNGRPCLAGAWAWPNGLFSLYYRIDGESYFLELSVGETDGGAVFEWMDVQAAVCITFGLDTVVLTPGEITQALGLTPTYTRAIGEPGRYTKAPATSNVWSIEDREPGPFEERLEAMLGLLRGHRAALDALGSGVNKWVSVGYRGYKDSMQGLHLSEVNVRLLADLGLSIDFDLYASGPDLPT